MLKSLSWIYIYFIVFLYYNIFNHILASISIRVILCFLRVVAMTWLTDEWYHACCCFISFILIGIYHYHFSSLRTCHLPGQQDLQIDSISMHCAFHAVVLPNLRGHFCLVLCSSGMIFLLMFCRKIFIVLNRDAMML